MEAAPPAGPSPQNQNVPICSGKMPPAGKPPACLCPEKKAVQWRPCVNPGNPVFSCMLESSTLTTSNFLTQPRSLLFKTTSSDYGGVPPTSQMVPCWHFPRDNTFTENLSRGGKIQNNYINTGIDKDSMFDYMAPLS